MSETGMRPRRRPPGFGAATEPDAPAPVPARSPRRPPVAPADADGGGLRNAPSRQLNIRVLEPVHQRCRALLREAADAGDEITMTELIHALLHEGPATAADARSLVKRWRRELV